jgi:hypothetical protein
MNTTGATFYPTATDCGKPGRYATDGESYPIFLVREDDFPDRPVEGKTVLINGEAYLFNYRDKVTGDLVFRRCIHVGDLVADLQGQKVRITNIKSDPYEPERPLFGGDIEDSYDSGYTEVSLVTFLEPCAAHHEAFAYPTPRPEPAA